MSETTSITNRNFLSPLNFKFQMKRAPHLNFFVQRVVLPSIDLPQIELPNPLLKVPTFGDQLQYGNLIVSYKVDEDLQNYLEIHDWMRALGKSSFQEFNTVRTTPLISGESLKSEIVLTSLTSNKNANYEFVFKDAFPISISELDFNTTDEDVDYLSVTATFKYFQFDIIKVT